MTFRTEFHDYPPDAMPEIPEGWADISWHNDAMPSFNTGNGLVVCTDYPGNDSREYEFGPRFIVMADPEIHNHNETLLESDDWNEVLAFVAARGGNNGS